MSQLASPKFNTKDVASSKLDAPLVEETEGLTRFNTRRCPVDICRRRIGEWRVNRYDVS